MLACESIFSRTSLDARPQNLHTFSKVIDPKYIQSTCTVGQARYSFHLPFSYDLQILLAKGNGASTNVEPWSYILGGGRGCFHHPVVMPCKLIGCSLCKLNHCQWGSLKPESIGLIHHILTAPSLSSLPRHTPQYSLAVWRFENWLHAPLSHPEGLPQQPGGLRIVYYLILCLTTAQGTNKHCYSIDNLMGVSKTWEGLVNYMYIPLALALGALCRSCQMQIICLMDYCTNPSLYANKSLQPFSE